MLGRDLYNPCLQNVQQAVEKALKSLVIEKSLPFKKTHSIAELKAIGLTEDECDFIDSIYLPTKYPIGSELPFFEPGKEICERPISLAERVLKEVKQKLSE